MSNDAPPTTPPVSPELTVPVAARRFDRRVGVFMKYASIATGLAILVYIFLTPYMGKESIKPTVSAFVILGFFVIFGMILKAAFSDSVKGEHLREGILILLREGEWKKYDVGGRASTTNVLGIFSGLAAFFFAGFFVSLSGEYKSKARLAFDAQLPLALDFEKILNLRPQNSTDVQRLRAYSANPKRDKDAGEIWVLTHASVPFALSASCFPESNA